MESAFRSIWTSILLAFVVVALCVGAFAQGGTGEITGLVTDPTGAVIAGAPVKLTNAATAEVRTTTTSPAGTYRFPALAIVGSYTLEVSPKGFKSVKVENIVVTVGTIVTRDVKLELGAATEQVTVEAGAQLVQTEDSSLSSDVDRRVWQDMPLEDRSQNEFIALLPGAEPANNAGVGTMMGGTDRGAAVNGTRSGTGNFLVEGFDNNDQGLGGAGSIGTGPGGANTTISPDAIQEYRVISGTPPAEYGKAGGFITDTVLKSGTNQWHGSLFGYNRIQALAANQWFSNNAGLIDHLVRNQVGGSIGGPIVKDRTFFYFTVEDQQLRASSPLVANDYTSAFQSFVSGGNFQAFMEGTGAYAGGTGFCDQAIGGPCPGAFAAQSSTGPNYTAMMAAQNLPLCVPGSVSCTNLSSAAENLYPSLVGVVYPVPVYGQLTVSSPEVLNQIRYTAKIDHKLTPNDQLTGAFLYDNADGTFGFEGGGNLVGPNEINHGRAINAGVTWSHTISPTILNQARFSYVRNTSNFPEVPGLNGVTSVNTAFDSIACCSGVTLGMTPDLPQLFTENEFIWKDDLSVTHGKHNFKGGGEFRRTRNGSSFDAFKYGYSLVNGVEDMLTDATFTNTVVNNPAFASVVAICDSIVGTGLCASSIPVGVTSINPSASTPTLPVYYRGYRANETAAYIQDDWRVTPRFTANLGVRWEYFGPPHNFQANIDSNFYTGAPLPFTNPCTLAPPLGSGSCLGTGAATPNPFMPTSSGYWGSFATGVSQVRNHDIWNKDLNNFGPRVGFSYDVLGNQRAIVRAGFGVMYDRMYNNIFENIRFNPPFFSFAEIGALGNGIPVSPATAANIYTYPYSGLSSYAGGASVPEARAMDQNLVTAYYEQAHLGVQYQIGKDMVWETNYIGTFGHKLLGILGRNIFDGLYASGLDETRPNPNFGNISFRTNCCDSNYHGLQTTLRKRFSSGLQFNGNYTYSKGMDDISDAFTTKNAGGAAYPTDSMNVHLDYGPSDFNVKHRVVGSFVYDLPFAKGSRWLGGWNISGIVSWQTGADFSVFNSNSSVDSNEDGQFNDRAVYLGPGKITNDINHNVSPATGYLNTGPSNWGLLNTSSTTPGAGTAFTPIACPASVNMGLWCEGTALGQMARNTLIGPGFFNTDFGVKKAFKITESTALRFEANFFNIFNHPNFLYPDPNLNDGTFGRSIGTFTNQQSGGPRITQLALRFDF
jgi:Carboxypeptidase regulatory-like domain